jgi:hypothetical protein
MPRSDANSTQLPAILRHGSSPEPGKSTNRTSVTGRSRGCVPHALLAPETFLDA